MNKITTLAAIAMFAMIMGMGAIAPAMAVPQGNNGNAKAAVCHFFPAYEDLEETILDVENSTYGVLYINEKAIPGHTTEEEGHVDDVFVGEPAEFDAWKTECEATPVVV